MNRKLAIVQRLVNALDDARTTYGEGAGKVAYPRLRDLLERIAHLHSSIADDLVGQMVGDGGVVTRRGSRLGPMRTLIAEKFAQISFDTDMAYANHAVQCETAILRGLYNAAAKIHDAELRDHLRMHCRDMERSSKEICCLRVTLLLHIGPRAAQALADMQVPALGRATAHRGAQQPSLEGVTDANAQARFPVCTAAGQRRAVVPHLLGVLRKLGPSKAAGWPGR